MKEENEKGNENRYIIMVLASLFHNHIRNNLCELLLVQSRFHFH